MIKVPKITADDIQSVVCLAERYEADVNYVTLRLRGYGGEAPAARDQILAILRFGTALTDLAAVLLNDISLHEQLGELEAQRKNHG